MGPVYRAPIGAYIFRQLLCAGAFISIVLSGAAVMPLCASADTATTSVATIDPHDPVAVEAKVRSYFADAPNMAAIAKCESGFRQYGADGNVLYDPSYSMVGVFQINIAHLPESLDRGMDIMTLDGNLAYARYLYTANGIDPWMDSFGCWGSATKAQLQVLGTSTVALDTPTTSSVPLGLSFGMISQSVLQLQQTLNKIGFVVSSTGPGSPGLETTKFGSLTRDAVRRFQCAKNITCSGDESTTGYGLVDSRTSAALLAAVGGTTTQVTIGGTASPTTATSTTTDKAAQIAQVESQIASLTGQLEVLNQRLNELTR